MNSKYNARKYSHLFPVCPCNGNRATPSHIKGKRHKEFQRISTLIIQSFNVFQQKISSGSNEAPHPGCDEPVSVSRSSA